MGVEAHKIADFVMKLIFYSHHLDCQTAKLQIIRDAEVSINFTFHWQNFQTVLKIDWYFTHKKLFKIFMDGIVKEVKIRLMNLSPNTEKMLLFVDNSLSCRF